MVRNPIKLPEAKCRPTFPKEKQSCQGESVTRGLRCPMPEGIMASRPSDESTTTGFMPSSLHFRAIAVAAGLGVLRRSDHLVASQYRRFCESVECEGANG